MSECERCKEKERMLRMKTDDWLKECREIGDLLAKLAEKDARIARLEKDWKTAPARWAFLERQTEDDKARLAEKDAEIERLATDALVALSRYTSTPEKGYRHEPLVLSMDIHRLGHERDALQAKLAEKDAEIERLSAMHLVNTVDLTAADAKLAQAEERARRYEEALRKIANPESIVTDGSESREEHEELYDFWHMVAANRINIANEALDAESKEEK